MFQDITGELLTATIIVVGTGFLVGSAMSAFTTYCTGGSTAEIMESAIEGVLTGAASAAIGLFMPTIFLPLLQAQRQVQQLMLLFNQVHILFATDQ